MWQNVAVACARKECMKRGIVGNYRTHVDQCHTSTRTSSRSRSNTSMNLPRSSYTTATISGQFNISNPHYNSFRIVELSTSICMYLDQQKQNQKTDPINQDRIFHCIQNCYSCYQRPMLHTNNDDNQNDCNGPDDHDENDDVRYHRQLQYHKTLQSLLNTCIESPLFTYKQKRSFKFWLRYINANDMS